jgi:hypothetical protein
MHETETAIIARDFLEKASRELVDYSIGFVKIEEKQDPIDAKLGGSGTLVLVEGKHAILTADHVLDHLPNSGKVGLVLPTRFGAQLHRVTVDMTLAQKVRIARGHVESEGPDLGTLLIPTDVVGTIKSIKSFYNLSRRQNQHLSHPLPIDLGVWMLCGMADEWTSDTVPEHDYERVKTFQGICADGKVSNERTTKGFDYLDFETKYDGSYEGPESYEGFSGGGLWQIVVAKTQNSDLVIKDKVLSGVAFYQSALVDAHRTILCHGRHSVYQATVDAIKNIS